MEVSPRVARHFGERSRRVRPQNACSDPYCYVSCGGSKPLRTKIKRQTLQPVWGELFKFKQSKGSGEIGLTGFDQINIDVFDYDEIGNDDFMGRLTIDLSYVIDKMGYIDKAGSTHMEWFALGGSESKASREVDAAVANGTTGAAPYGSLHLKFKVVPVAERRTEVVYPLSVAVKKFRTIPEKGDPSDKASLKKAVYAKVEFWDGQTKVLPSRRYYDRLGCASINCEIFIYEGSAKMCQVVQQFLKEKENSKRYRRDAVLEGINGTDGVMKISMHDDATGALIGKR